MQTWTDTTFDLADTSDLLCSVTMHATCVSLFVPGHALDGRGFCIYFTGAHLEVVEKLVEALHELQDQETVRALQASKQGRHTTHTDLDATIEAQRAQHQREAQGA